MRRDRQLFRGVQFVELMARKPRYLAFAPYSSWMVLTEEVVEPLRKLEVSP